MKYLFAIIFILFSTIKSHAEKTGETVLMPVEEFIQKALGEGEHKPKLLWLKGDLKESCTKILGHRYPALRIRYWENAGKTVWILEEVGKTRPITAGFVVKNQKIEFFKVLVYRESHGWEIKYPFFSDQFKDVGLTDKNRLDKNIDGISGATLSVNAVKKLSRLALLFDREIQSLTK